MNMQCVADFELQNVDTPAQDETNSGGSDLHVLWITDTPDFVGGAEGYMFNTARLLHQRGVRSTLMYDVNQSTSTNFLQGFDQSFPIVDLEYQIGEIAPDVCYVQRIHDTDLITRLGNVDVPVLRFIHDHKLFCLREHKYTTLGSQTCTQTMGMNCYSCLGFVGRSETWPGIALQTLSPLQQQQDANKQLDGFVVGSKYMAQHIAEHGFDRDNIHTVPLYAFPPITDGAEVKREEDLVLFAGGLIHGKGLDVLLSAIARTSQPVRLAIAGSGRQEQRYRDQCEQLGLSDRVEFLGRQSREELATYFRRATCLVMPSRAPETFGQTGLEAQAHGTPVIATKVGGTGEWLSDGETGLAVPPNDVPSLATAIDRLVADKELATRLTQAATLQYVDRLTPEHHVDRLLQTLNTYAKHGVQGA